MNIFSFFQLPCSLFEIELIPFAIPDEVKTFLDPFKTDGWRTLGTVMLEVPTSFYFCLLHDVFLVPAFKNGY